MAKQHRQTRTGTTPLRIITTGPFPYDWPRIAERIDPNVIPQERESSCTAACIQMLLWPQGGGLTQAQLAEPAYLHSEPAPTHHILPTLRKLEPKSDWQTQLVGADQPFDFLNAFAPWIAFMLLADTSDWHAVLVDGATLHSELLIRDPHRGTSYRMVAEEFNRRWSGVALFAARKRT